MKKTMTLAAFAAMFMFASCQKEDVKPGQDSQSDELVFTATIDQSATKTTINTNGSDETNRGKVSWEVNDEISVTDATNTAVYYIKDAADIAADGSATFTYKSGTRPTAAASSYTASYGNAITTAQTHSATVGKLPMTGASDSGNKTKLNFTVSCGLLKLNLTASSAETDKTISKVEITGTPTGGAKTTYTLSCSSEVGILSGADFYIALPAGSYDNMVFYNKSGFVCQKSAKTAMSISANKIQPVTLTGIAFNLLPGEFSVSATKKVQFTKGNLYYNSTDSKYHIETTQNATYATLGQSAYDATHVCHFFWSNTTDWQTSGKEPWASAYTYSSQAADDKFFCGIDNPMTVDGQSGLYALTGGSGEWNYLINNRPNASTLYKCGVSVTTSAGTVTNCVVIAPDGYTGTIVSSYDSTAWATAESSGLVCLPAAGCRNGSLLGDGGSYGGYWSATPVAVESYALSLIFDDSSVNPDFDSSRVTGFSVRLVCSVSK